MNVITAYQSEDGSLHLESAQAQAADCRHSIGSRVDAFLAASPLGAYECCEFNAWLKSERGQDALRTLVGRDLSCRWHPEHGMTTEKTHVAPAP